MALLSGGIGATGQACYCKSMIYSVPHVVTCMLFFYNQETTSTCFPQCTGFLPRRFLTIIGVMMLTVCPLVLGNPHESESQGPPVDEFSQASWWADWADDEQTVDELLTYSVIVVAEAPHGSNLFRDRARAETHTRGVISVQFAHPEPSGDLIVDAAGRPSNAFMVTHDERADKRVRIIHTEGFPPSVKMSSNQVMSPLIRWNTQHRS